MNATLTLIGTINKVNATKTSAWISRRDLHLSDRYIPYSVLATSKDIFLHADDCSDPLRVGMEVQFGVVKDVRRERAFRAKRAFETERGKRHAVAAAGVDIHVDDKKVDNPSVPIRWCLSSEMHARVKEGLRAGNGYSVLLVARLDQDEGMGFHEMREVKRWNELFTIVSFSTPGDWAVSVLLFERCNQKDGSNTSNDLNQHIKNRLLRKEKYTKVYMKNIPPLSDLEFMGAERRLSNLLRAGNHYDEGVCISAGSLNIKVPKEVFATLSPGMKAYVNYFFRRSPADECNFRRRLLIMVPGAVPYAMLEIMKRSLYGLFSMVSVLFLLRGSVRLLGSTFRPEVNFSFRLNDLEEKYFTNNEWDNGYELLGPWKARGGVYVTPLMFGLYGFVLWVLLGIVALIVGVLHRVHLPPMHLMGGSQWVLVPLALSIVASFNHKRLAAALAWAIEKNVVPALKEASLKSHVARAQRVKKYEKRMNERTVSIGKQEAVVAEQYADAIVCGPSPAQVQLTALPAELRTFGMWYRSAKRAVCRPFA